MINTVVKLAMNQNSDVKAGLALIASTIAAILISNSALSALYGQFLSLKFYIGLGDYGLSKPLLLWINDGLMAIFFFLIGLEIKREMIKGQLNSLKKSTLPLVAAIGGMIAPAVIFVMVNYNSPETLNGWAIPAATDIAFALGILALLGTRAPVSLKILLLAIAIIDDLGAIIIIALFYSADIATSYLYSGLGALAVAAGFCWLGVRRLWVYALIGAFSWVCFLKSGIHPTLAGVVLALTIPMQGDKDEPTMLEDLEHSLHWPVTFLILPIFAFANAGVSLAGLSFDMFLEPLPLGIALGLFLGKQLGVFGTTWVAVKTGLTTKPDGTNWMQIYGLSCLTGIGFTMSLFIGGLAFDDASIADQMRLGVLSGSIISGLVGFMVLYRAGDAKTPSST